MKCQRRPSDLSAEAKRRFEQVAWIANTVKGHRNVSEFFRFYKEPYATMMDNDACFDFISLRVDKKLNTQLNNLEEVLHFIDAEFEFDLQVISFTSPRFTSPRFSSPSSTSSHFTSPVQSLMYDFHSSTLPPTFSNYINGTSTIQDLLPGLLILLLQ